jgi:DNA-binding PadR family transcriptional regulator
MRTLGDFERAVLLAILNAGENAYGVAIRQRLEKTLKRPVSYGAVYTTLDRLLEKGFVSTRTGDPTPQRGGRAKKFFKVEAAGRKALAATRKASDAIWKLHAARG